MEFMPKPAITTIFFLFLLFSVPFSSGETGSENIYEIDYRGPETHSHYRPSPGRSGHLPFVHGHASSSSKSKGVVGGGNGGVTTGPQIAMEVHG